MAPLLTVREVAELLRTSPWQVYSYADKGVLPAGVVVRLGRNVRFVREELEKWIAAGGKGLAKASKAGGSIQ